MAAVLTAGQRHESAFFTDVMDAVRVLRPTGRPIRRPEAARGGPSIRLGGEPTVVLTKNIESVIPARNRMHTGPGRPPTCDEEKYEQRNVVERLVGRLKERRRIATRYEKKASHNEATAPKRCSSGPSSANI
jgi:hypothetical protein